MRHSFFATCGLVMVSAVMLTACDVSTPSRVETGQIQLLDRVKTVTIDPEHINPAQIDAIADDYNYAGKGDINVVISFLQGPKNEIGAHASGNKVKKAFAAQGLKNVRVDYVPVDNEDFAMKAVVSYSATVAAAPDGCGRMTGYQGADTLEGMHDYQLGCESKDIISQMVARPEDLMGTSGMPDGDSRRQGAVVERYKTGTPNPRMEGINASDVGQ